MTALCTAAAFAAIGFASPAAAQATRTWVSGVGDDVNPCSRTAPCKTFAGAISKTAAGGEINCLDPGGFGAVTITKSLTIDCHYTEGGALAGGNGIVVNAAATDVVVLRGLDIFGVSPPTHGVRIIAGGAVSIEDCVIRRFNSANSFGISFQPTGTTNLYVTNTTITQNGNGATGGGINIAPTGASGVGRVSIKNTNVLQNSGRGISVDMSGGTGPGIAATIDESVISGTSGDGIAVVTPGPGINVMVTNSSVTNNSTNGIIGVGAGAVIRVGDTTITGNAFAGGAGVVSVSTYGDNRLDANANNGTFNAPALVKR
jgi:hypothetical protein